MNHLGDTNKMVSETPSVCPFCGSYVATLDDGKPCGDSEGNWTAFRCLTSWHRGYSDPRNLQSKTCETVERHKLYDHIKRLEEAGNELLWAFCPASVSMMTERESDALKLWNQAKEDKL